MKVHSNCLGVVNTIRQGTIPSTELGIVVADVLSIQIVDVIFIPRLCNMVVHCLAKLSTEVQASITWVNYVPPFVEKTVLKDLLNFLVWNATTFFFLIKKL